MNFRTTSWAVGLAGVAAVAVMAVVLADAPKTKTVAKSAAPAAVSVPAKSAVPAPAPVAVAPAPAAKKAVARTTVTRTVLAPGQAGMVMSIDPETGTLGMPSQADRAALGLDAAQQEVVLEEVKLPGYGGYMLDLKGTGMDYSVMRVGPDGKRVFDCVQGPQAAEKLMKTPVTPETRTPALEEK